MYKREAIQVDKSDEPADWHPIDCAAQAVAEILMSAGYGAIGFKHIEEIKEGLCGHNH